MRVLVVGGSSGIGLEIARLLRDRRHEVTVTGRHDPQEPGLGYHHFYVRDSTAELVGNIEDVVRAASPTDLLVYAAGFYVGGMLADTTVESIRSVNNVGIVAPELLVRAILAKENRLSGFIAITALPAEEGEEFHATYAAAKAALSVFTQAISRGNSVDKALEVAPAGTDTPFWRSTPDRDRTAMLKPAWVAMMTIAQWAEPFRHRSVNLNADGTVTINTEE